MREGVICKLYRINGSSKKAKIDLDEEYNIRAYKYPDGEVKKKYCCSLRYVRDLQFHFSDSDELWQASPFSAEKGLFDSNRVPP